MGVGVEGDGVGIGGYIVRDRGGVGMERIPEHFREISRILPEVSTKFPGNFF